MNNDEIAALLLDKLSIEQAYVLSEDGQHYKIIAVGEIFGSMSRVKQQQFVYAPLMGYIQSAQMHAVSIKTYTPEQWSRERKLLGL